MENGAAICAGFRAKTRAWARQHCANSTGPLAVEYCPARYCDVAHVE